MELLEYIHVIRKRIWVLIVTTVLFGIITSIVNIFFLDEIYRARVSIYVANKKHEANTMSYQEIMAGEYFAKDYQELIKSRSVCEAVIQKLQLTNVTADKLARMISIELKPETRFISLYVESPDNEQAALIANTVADEFRSKAVELLNIENAYIVDRALVPKNPAKPKVKQNIAISVLIGMLLGVGIILLWDYLDNTIKNPEDVEKYLQLPVLATIPDHESL